MISIPRFEPRGAPNGSDKRPCIGRYEVAPSPWPDGGSGRTRQRSGHYETTATESHPSFQGGDARENTAAIELVDIDRLLELMIEEGLGVKETRALKIETDFFKPYQAKP